MDEEPDWADGDPEIAALLTFAPVVRKNIRHDGWTPAHQRGHVAWLAFTGNVDKAAQAVGRSQSGAWTVRNSAGGEGFGQAWDKALALHHARRLAQSPEPALGPPPRGAPARSARELRREQARRSAEPPELEEEERAELLDEVVKLYARKLQSERKARLAGRVVEADLFVRQLTFIEIVLAVGGRAQQLLDEMKHGDLHLVRIAATPLSTLLEQTRRALWLEKGEADRPPPAPLGAHDASRATGLPSHHVYNSVRDGDYEDWRRREDAKAALAAAAQAAWEEKARAEAGAWAEREADNPQSSPGFPGEGERAQWAGRDVPRTSLDSAGHCPPAHGGGASPDAACDVEPHP